MFYFIEKYIKVVERLCLAVQVPATRQVSHPQLYVSGYQVRHDQALTLDNFYIHLLNAFCSFFQAASNMQQFMRSNALSPMVMVCTDRSSRGMDFDRAEARFFVCCMQRGLQFRRRVCQARLTFLKPVPFNQYLLLNRDPLWKEDLRFACSDVLT